MVRTDGQGGTKNVYGEAMIEGLFVLYIVELCGGRE